MSLFERAPESTDATAVSMSPLLEAAVASHEMFLAYSAAGFGEDQALRLVAYTLSAYRTDDTEGPNG